MDHVFHDRDTALIGKRTHAHAIFQAVADLEVLSILDDAIQELVGHAVLDQEAVGATQTWPALRNLAAAETSIAFSRSASLKTMTGA